MNLRKQVEPLLSAALQASSKQRRAQRATSRLAWVLRRLRRASETITSKAGRDDLTVPPGVGQYVALNCSFRGHLCERLVDDALETKGTIVQIVVGDRLLIALAEIFVGDVERHEHG